MIKLKTQIVEKIQSIILKNKNLYELDNLLSPQTLKNIQQEYSNIQECVEFILSAKKSISQNGFAIFSGANPDDKSFLLFIYAICQNLFYAPTTDFIDKLNVQMDTGHPFDFSETTRPGFFHTDFCSYDAPPRYVALQCTETDPRHPFYGRNQVAHLDKILDVLKKTDPKLIQLLKETSITYGLGEKKKSLNILSEKNGELIVTMPHAHMVEENESEEFIKTCGTPLVPTLNQICLSVCDDFVLDKGDIIVLDNYKTTHRRGECSLGFSLGLHEFLSRKISTIRFE